MVSVADREFDDTLRMLVSQMWGRQKEKLAGDLEMQGTAESTVNAFYPVDVLAGSLWQ